MPAAQHTSPALKTPSADFRRAQQKTVANAELGLAEIHLLMQEMGTFLKQGEVLRQGTFKEVPAQFLISIVRITELAQSLGRVLGDVPAFHAPQCLLPLGSDIAKVFDPKLTVHPKGRLAGFNALQRYVEHCQRQLSDIARDLAKA